MVLVISLRPVRPGSPDVLGVRAPIKVYEQVHVASASAPSSVITSPSSVAVSPYTTRVCPRTQDPRRLEALRAARAGRETDQRALGRWGHAQAGGGGLSSAAPAGRR